MYCFAHSTTSFEKKRTEQVSERRMKSETPPSANTPKNSAPQDATEVKIWSALPFMHQNCQRTKTDQCAILSKKNILIIKLQGHHVNLKLDYHWLLIPSKHLCDFMRWSYLDIFGNKGEWQCING